MMIYLLINAYMLLLKQTTIVFTFHALMQTLNLGKFKNLFLVKKK